MVETSLIPYSDEHVQLEGFSASSSGKRKSPLVILCHAWRGRDEFIEEKTKQIASLGFVGFALDMYGKGILGNSKEENSALKKPFIEDRIFLKKRALKGFEAACHLPDVDLARIAVLGFGFGGICALDLARSGLDLRGVISIYGHFGPPKTKTRPIKAKVLILHGYNDPISPISELHAFQEEMNNENVNWQSHVFSNTYHAFANPFANDRSAGLLHNPDSAHQAWELAKKFLMDVLD